MSNLPRNWVLHVEPVVLKIVSRFPKNDISRLLEVINSFPENPYFGDIDKMKGELNSWRRRVGSYRIFYKILVQEKIILVFHLERRTSKTY